jgi:competence protein ComFB
MEVIIEELMPNILEKYEEICKCEICIDDIRAIALNNLKPRYVTTKRGCLYEKTHLFEKQFLTDVTSKITEAIEKVSKNPKHDYNRKESLE